MDYLKLAELNEKLESTSKRLEQTSLITEFIKSASKENLRPVVLMVLGNVYPSYSRKKIGIADKIMIKAIASTSGRSEKEIVKIFKKTGDLGAVAEQVLKDKKQATLFSKKLSISDVFEDIKKIADFEGKGTVDKKISIIKKLLANASPVEAKHIARLVIGTTRMGVGEGIVRDAIAGAFNVDSKKVENAENILNDYGGVAEIAKLEGDKGLESIKLELFKPSKVLLAQRVESIEELFKRTGEPADLEYKYDGFRVLIHKKGDKVKLFTRRLEDVTKQFPDVVEYSNKYIKDSRCIMDSEVIGIEPKTGRWLPFQKISQRIKRKYDIKKIVKEIPVIVNVFDVLMINGKSLLKTPLKERIKLIEENITQEKNRFVIAKRIISSDEKEVRKFFMESLALGNEGIMGKNLNSIYEPGLRVGYWVKLKPAMEPLDLAITGADWGKGKRAQWLASFDISCRKQDEFKRIGKMGTGLTDENFKKLTKELKPYIIREKGTHVDIIPKIVVEVGYEEIQESPTYESGYALRFPKLLQIRYEKDVSEVDDIEKIKSLYSHQRGK
ncbi:MAG: ATP-dependent DNA ligase [Candidatus Nanoarchaeia archaeon]|nr:ATP-dependent DNA ligase [Candidatus Nanoarchaeia archaeon]